MNIPAVKDLEKFRAQLVEDERVKVLEAAQAAFEQEFERRVREGVKSFRFILSPHFVEVGEDLLKEVKDKGYVSMIVNDDFYGPVLHVEFKTE